MRNMGGLHKQMPVTFWVYLIGALALSGIFPLAGFFSKDEILLDAAKNYPRCLCIADPGGLPDRFLHGPPDLMVFFGPPRHAAAGHAQESPGVMTVPLMVLAVLAILGGVLNFPGLNSLTAWLGDTIQPIVHEATVAPGWQFPGEDFNPLAGVVGPGPGTYRDLHILVDLRAQAAGSRAEGPCSRVAALRPFHRHGK